MTPLGFFVPGNRSSRPPTFPWKTTLLCVATFAPGVMAQDVLAPPPTPPPLVPSSVEEYQTNQTAQMRAFGPSAPAAGENQPFTLGPIVVRPNVSYQFIYGNGAQSAPGQQQNFVLQQLSPGVALEAGGHWTLNYAPTFNFYSSGSFGNSINQNAQLQWGTAWRHWFISASQTYAYSDDPETATAGQTEESTYVTTVSGVYHFNDRISANLGFSQIFENYGNVQSSTNLLLGIGNSRTWSTSEGLTDQFWPRFNAGVSIGVGYNQQQGSPDSVLEQYQAQLNWRATEKFSFQISGGLEDLEYLNSTESAFLTPIFGGGVQYQPFAPTKISINANRTVSPSAYQGQNVEMTSIVGDLNQRLFGFMSLDLNGGFSWEQYAGTVPGETASRNDDIYTFGARLSCPFPKRGTVSIFYELTTTTSTQSGFASGASAFGYSSDQVGFAISYAY